MLPDLCPKKWEMRGGDQIPTEFERCALACLLIQIILGISITVPVVFPFILKNGIVGMHEKDHIKDATGVG